MKGKIVSLSGPEETVVFSPSETDDESIVDYPLLSDDEETDEEIALNF